MPVNAPKMRDCLRRFDFQKLFTEELGWDHHAATLDIPVDSQTYHLTAIAQKRGLVAFQCNPSLDGHVPDHATRRRIDRILAKSHFEHLIVFSDAKNQSQVWQWVKREVGRPAASREHVWHTSQPGDALIQKLDRIAFDLSEEEAIGGIADVVGRVRAGFDVERITKRFYERFKSEHDTFAAFLKGIPDKEMHSWYVSVMLNRLMFIYFIQKKGFLENDRDYLRNRLARMRQTGKDGFYRNFLCPLFFEGFATRQADRPPTIQKLLGKVPYLNGGLFLRHQIEELHGQHIQIADAAFDKVFAFFDAYQWHLDERPLRKDDEINPDVLGYIFEKYINQKQMGAYYTKEDITEYISKNTIIPFLFNHARQQPGCADYFAPGGPVWHLLAEEPDRYIYDAMRKGVIASSPSPGTPGEGRGEGNPPVGSIIPLPPETEAGVKDVSKRGGWNRPADPAYALPTETWREHVARRQRCLETREKLRSGQVADINDLITLNLDIRQFAQDVIANCDSPDLLRAFYGTIEKVTVLDPTCGSGAFLFAALGILEPLYEACIERMESFVSGSIATPSIVKPSVAVLRSKMLGEQATAGRFADFKHVLDRIAKHKANQRYFILKSIIVNNLFGVDIMEEAVEICKLRLFLKLVAQVDRVDQIEPLPDIDFNIRAGNTLVGYATEKELRTALDFGGLDFEKKSDKIIKQCERLDQQFKQFRASQLADKPGSLAGSLKQAILKPLGELRDELDNQLAVSYGTKDKHFDQWRKSHQPFHWFVEFYGIMKEGGFDVVIGNPPYVVYSGSKFGYVLLAGQYKTLSTKNLYAIVFEKCLSLATASSPIGLIVQLTAISSERLAPLQDLLINRGQLLATPFPRRPQSIFEGVEMPVVILLALCNKASELVTTRINRFYAQERPWAMESLRAISHASRLHGHRIAKFGSAREISVYGKITKQSDTIESLTGGKGDDILFYQEACRYWVKACDGLPFFSRNGKGMEPPHGRVISFKSKNAASFVACLLNSSLFYWFYSVFSDCEHVNDGLLRSFIIAPAILEENWVRIGQRLQIRLEETSTRKTITTKQGHTIAYDEMKASKAKSVIDEIDRLLAHHYGFTDEELDFIINYDIKYRMGGEEAKSKGAAESEDASQTFPATVRDRQLCAVALELVKAAPGLSVETWLDGMVLAVKPETCEKALFNARRKRFQQLVQKHPLDLFTAAALPWNDMRQTLVGAGAVEIDERTQTVSVGAQWQTFRDAMGKLPAGFVPLVAEALKNITENIADLVEGGVDVDDVKRIIRQARTEVAA